MTQTCNECGRVFDLLDTNDSSEWYYGHDCGTCEDCEAGDKSTCEVCGLAEPLESHPCLLELACSCWYDRPCNEDEDVDRCSECGLLIVDLDGYDGRCGGCADLNFEGDPTRNGAF